ncbi:MAG TPA: hypothetical protein VGL72_15190 [Bryobacteraceae bacterium]
MPLTEHDALTVRESLQRILASPGFSRNERLSRFLRFVVETHLQGRGEEIKESVIAVEVLERGTDHDPKRNSIVRTEAARLRARLQEYYSTDGQHDALVIELPKGTYVPAFRANGIGAVPETVEAVAPAAKVASGRRWWVAVAALAAIAAGAAIWWWTAHRSGDISIAVLPLTNVGPASANDYFADGMTDELIRNLSIIEGLAVRSQTSSFALKGKARDIKEAGRQLNADYILEGSVLRDAERLRINVQLVRVQDDYMMWSGRYDRELRNVMALQDEIARGVVNSLRLKLGQGKRRYEVDPQAYDLYLRAIAMWYMQGIVGANESVQQLRQSVERDPSFAPAYALLASDYAVRSGQFRYDIPAELVNMRAAADKAIELDPLSPEVLDAQGLRSAREAKWQVAEKSFLAAIRMQPHQSQTRLNYALWVLLPLGRLDEAVRQSEIAEADDPLSVSVEGMASLILIAAGNYEEAARVAERLSDNFRPEYLGRARLFQGKTEEGVRIMQEAYDKGEEARSELRGSLAFAYGRSGRRDLAQKIVAETPPLNPLIQARFAAAFGDKDRALQALDQAAIAGAVRVGRELHQPEMAFLKGDPRVKDLQRKIGLPPE